MQMCYRHQRILDMGESPALGLIPPPQPTNIISGKTISWKSILKSHFGFSCEDVENVVSGFPNKEDNKRGSFVGGSPGDQAGVGGCLDARSGPSRGPCVFCR